MINQNLKILHTASIFLTCTVSTLLQSLLALYQLLLYENVCFYNVVMACLTFYCKVRTNTHTYPIFLFCFMVQSSSRAIDKELGSNDDHLPPLTMAVTIYFKVIWQDFVQFLCQTKKNSIDRIKEMVTKFNDKPKSQSTAFLYCTGLISHVIVSQIFDTARNSYCIISDQYIR